MNTIESGIVGYIAGLVVGSLILIMIIGYVLVTEGNLETPTVVLDMQRTVLEYKEANNDVFTICFILGILSGIGYFTKEDS